VELHEDPNQAAIREPKEEVGLDVILWSPDPPLSDGKYKGLVTCRHMNRHGITDQHEHVDMIYFATTDSREVRQGTTEVSKAIRWFTAEELKMPHYGISPIIQQYAKEALEALSAPTLR
jgi:8-oxo-dGTP pyrophosphatase MutT (NUDIX family)